MSIDLNTTLEQWLAAGGSALRRNIDEEIGNRAQNYPKLGELLRERPIDIPQFTERANQCWLLYRFSKMRLGVFSRDEKNAQTRITQLIDEFPERSDEAVQRIDKFIEYAVAGGFTDHQGRRDWAGAAKLASLILTSRYPGTFVDYPSDKRWREFAQRLGYAMPQVESYGQRIIWCTDFAHEIAVQPVFRLTLYKPDVEPLWVVSALCWASGREGEAGDSPPPDPAPISEDDSLPVGLARLPLDSLRRKAVEKSSLSATAQERTANYYVRSHAIRAYALRRADGVCEGGSARAPFEKPSGEPFLEVHHIDRLADGGPDAPDAVAALCPNCHRRAHYAHDAESFNAALKRHVQQLERDLTE